MPRELWLSNWHSVRTDIDPVAIAILGRIIRLNPAFEAHRAAALAALGLTPEVSDLIISLLRSGPPHALNSGALSPEATYPISSSGAMTYRVDRAEALGLVERRRDPQDRRGVLVGLTIKGLDLANRDVDAHMELTANFLASFSAAERAALSRLLQKLLAALLEPNARLTRQ